MARFGTQSSGTATPMGIGVITYNRLDVLTTNLDAIKRLTAGSYELVVADDGSSDGTREWLLERGIGCISGPNRGIAWNKNRALYYLLEATRCDPVLILEDDALPSEAGWDLFWRDAGLAWGHVNAHRDWLAAAGHVYAGLGTPQMPYHSRMCTGQCTVSTRAALRQVGYLDTRFLGYGWEHVEWTERFAAAGFYGGRHRLAIRGGLTHLDPDTWEDHPKLAGSGPGEGRDPGEGAGRDPGEGAEGDFSRNDDNEKLMLELVARLGRGEEPIRREAWRGDAEREAFLAEVSALER